MAPPLAPISAAYSAPSRHPTKHAPLVPSSAKKPVPKASGFSPLQWIVGGAVAGLAADLFSTYFPFIVDPTFGVVTPQIYQAAWYSFDERSVFDNSALTYGTDYLVALAMTGLALWLHRLERAVPLRGDRARFMRTHMFRSKGLVLSYALSVLAGAISHQHFTSVELRNTVAFRFLWTVCVGSVTAAAGWMGSIATLWCEFDNFEMGDKNWMPLLPAKFWVAFAAMGTFIVMAGGWSYQRPACDIFVAGITQIACSGYCVVLLWKGLPTLRISWNYRRCGMVFFVLNAPLLPLYPGLVATGLTLGQINAILHTCLLITWSSQAHALGTVAKAMQEASNPPPMAVPVRR